ncbi:hypothetical protein [Microscilla marina]|uniref:hypothetical protein n=1 Tax=Microscilla marina TaxID=1027 RepID=UPI0005D47EA1|nr:hypothetical protein [Microscilla marina]
MMKNLIVLLIYIFISSCVATRTTLDDLPGEFFGQTKKSKKYLMVIYHLIIKQDGSFIWTQKMPGATPTCEGKWEVVNNKILYLKCNEERDLTTILSSGFMNRRSLNVEILSNSKLKIDDVVLRKKK